MAHFAKDSKGGNEGTDGGATSPVPKRRSAALLSSWSAEKRKKTDGAWGLSGKKTEL